MRSRVSELVQNEVKQHLDGLLSQHDTELTALRKKVHAQRSKIQELEASILEAQQNVTRVRTCDSGLMEDENECRCESAAVRAQLAESESKLDSQLGEVVHALLRGNSR